MPVAYSALPYCPESKVRCISSEVQPQILRLRWAQRTRPTALRMTALFGTDFGLRTVVLQVSNFVCQRACKSGRSWISFRLAVDFLTHCRDRAGLTLVQWKVNGVPEAGEITMLLRDWKAGDPAAVDHLFELVYPQLRQIAGSLFRGERTGHLLQPTSVVNELFLKLRFEDREHFYSLSVRLMRRVLVDHARGRKTKAGRRDSGAIAGGPGLGGRAPGGDDRPGPWRRTSFGSNFRPRP